MTIPRRWEGEPDGPTRTDLVLSQELSSAVDKWRQQHPDLISRAEAIRRLLAERLLGSHAKPASAKRPKKSAPSTQPERQAGLAPHFTGTVGLPELATAIEGGWLG